LLEASDGLFIVFQGRKSGILAELISLQGLDDYFNSFPDIYEDSFTSLVLTKKPAWLACYIDTHHLMISTLAFIAAYPELASGRSQYQIENKRALFSR
jgi:hypothetical protein